VPSGAAQRRDGLETPTRAAVRTATEAVAAKARLDEFDSAAHIENDGSEKRGSVR
jgi:hypothetical protein